MQVIHVLSGPAFGEGLVVGRDFKCTLTSCYGIGARHADFLELQNQLNRLSTVARFSRLTVDGKIGSGTVAAIKAVATYIAGGKSGLGTATAAALATMRAAASKEAAAAAAVDIAGIVRAAVDGVPAGPATSTPPGGGAPTPIPATSPVPGAPVPKQDPHDVATKPPILLPPNVEKTIVEKVVEVPDPAGKRKLWLAGGAAVAVLAAGTLVAWGAARSRERR